MGVHRPDSGLKEIRLPRRRVDQNPGHNLPREGRRPRRPTRFEGKLRDFWAWPIYFLNGKTVLIPNRSLKIMDDLLETKDQVGVIERFKMTDAEMEALFEDQTFSAVFQDKMVRANIRHGLTEEWFLEQMYNIYANVDGTWSQRDMLEALKEIGTRKAPKQQTAIHIEKPIINITMGALEASKERREIIEAKIVDEREADRKTERRDRKPGADSGSV